MKGIYKNSITLGLLVVTSLFSCSGNSSAPLYYVNDNGEIAHDSDIKIYYPKNNDVPYISLEDGVALASELRQSAFEDKKYKYTFSQDNGVATVTDERGTKAVFDANNQTVTIDNYDSFAVGYRDGQLPLSPAYITPGGKAIKLVNEESSYTPGNAVTLKLSDYPSIKLEKGDNGLLIPIATFNDIFYTGSPSLIGIAYNYNNMYISSGLVSISTGSLSELGKHYYGSAKVKKEVSKDLAQYSYDETMFALDHFYGLKSVRNISSFKSFVKEKGLEEDLLSGNIEKMDDAYATLFLKCLEDGHTSYASPTAFTNYETFKVKDSSRSEAVVKKTAENKAMDDVRAEHGLNKPFEVRGDTAFIFFDDFMEMDETKLYGTITEKDISTNNTLLFAYAYKEIKKNPAIKNVVVDLVTNNGGDATGLVYCLGTLIGKHYLDGMNPLTGARSHLTYATDINVDGKIDENDVPLCKDYNIYMLDSKFAFSCGNLFPVAAKYNNPNVKILGDRTGGGTCVVSSLYTGLGSYVIKSGMLMLTKKTDTGYTHIEDGAAVDIPVGYDRMLDRNYIVDLLKAS